MAQAGVLAFCNPRRRKTTPAVAKTLRPWPEPKSTISEWKQVQSSQLKAKEIDAHYQPVTRNPQTATVSDKT
ncbi:MAG: hypothetical protein WBV95_14720, partial [Desulfobacterales bacterium]